MPREERRSLSGRERYGRQTLRPLNCLVFILPMLVVFHVGTAFYGSDLLAPRDINVVLRHFGATVAYLPALLVIVALFLQHVAHRDRLRVQARTLAGMLGESICWILPLIAMAHVTGRLWVHQASAAGPPASGQAPEGASASVMRDIVSAVGAGIYEEFIFRMVLISLMLLLLVDVFDLRKDAVTVASVIVAAVAFSLYHFSAEQFAGWGSFPWYDFVFRALAGIYLGAVFVFRGFGIAVGVHAIYNIYTVFYHMRTGPF